jgi:YesN/AraC family two-component response regulator
MRVLIVEDELTVRTFLCRVVTALMPGAEVVTASDGYLGLLAFLAEPFDLVISDNQMPRMTGLELLLVLRERSTVPFIMVSGDPSFARTVIRSGASAFLAKPLGVNDLRTTISRALATAISYTEPCAK